MDKQASPRTDGAFGRASENILALSGRHSRLLLVVMLLLLHFAAFRGESDAWARALLLSHFGLLLLWQPFFQGRTRLTVLQAISLACVIAAIALWLNAWLLGLWIVMLASLVGGKVYGQQARWQRASYLVVVVYLLALLVVVVIPDLLPESGISADVRVAAEFGLPVLVFSAAALPGERDAGATPFVVDFFYSIFLMLLIAVVVLGSFTFMTLGRTTYLEAMTYTIFTVAAMVLVIALTWGPRSGFAGVQVLFTRYLLSRGLPLEQWLYFLSDLALREQRPDRFVRDAAAGLAELDWIAGAAWRAGDDEGRVGEATGEPVVFETPELLFTLYSRYRLSAALEWHLRLLAQMLCEFYVARVRERTLLDTSYLRAVHETGARVTHDVKNILQSMQVLCSVVARDDVRESEAAQALLRSQLPALAQRLASTVDRLQAPEAGGDAREPLEDWWASLQRERAGDGLQFLATGTAGGRIPGALFDSVAGNLIANALVKRAVDPAVTIEVRLDRRDPVRLSVTDTGTALDSESAARLFKGPIPSQNGLGIGLFQAARQARAAGFELSLDSNRDGEVRFVLSESVG